jgi:hypothetical protein
MRGVFKVSCMAAISFVSPYGYGHAATPPSFKLDRIIQIPGKPLKTLTLAC